MSTFVSVGNATQAFRRFVDAVAGISHELPQPVFIQHGATPLPSFPGEAAPYMAMADFNRRIQQATLVITHAGAGTIIQSIQAGKVPVVMPRLASLGEHVDDHQVEFTTELEKAGKVVVASTPEELPGAVQQALRLQAARSRNLEPPRVAGLVAAKIAAYAGGGSG